MSGGQAVTVSKHDSCHVMSRHVMLCHVMLCHVMLCHVMLCHVTSRQVMLGWCENAKG
jgi:hypothetical protein